jgi:hypothetical protein
VSHDVEAQIVDALKGPLWAARMLVRLTVDMRNEPAAQERVRALLTKIGDETEINICRMVFRESWDAATRERAERCLRALREELAAMVPSEGEP